MSRKTLKTGFAWATGISTCLLTLAASIAANTSKPGEEFKLTILHTNDLHSHDESFSESGRETGGFARVGHEIRRLKAKAPSQTVVVDAGDIFQGTPLFSKYQGECEVTMLNKMGYDIYTIGNHEFDEGTENLAKQLKNAKFDVVNCNMDLSEEPGLASVVKPSVVKTINGQKVGFVGGVTPDLCSVSLTTGKVKIKTEGDDWIAPIAKEVKRLKDEGVNKIIMVTHIGVEGDKMIGQQVPDVDVIIGGHSHTRLDKPVIINHSDGTTTTIVQTGCYGRTLGELELTFDKDGKVIDQDTYYKLHNMTASIPQDADLKAYVDEKVAPLLPLRKMVLSHASADYDNFFRNYTWDSPLGDLITDALWEEGMDDGVQIAFENRGGMRARIDKGPVTEETVQEILPFDNKITFASVDGACLMKALEHSVGTGLGGRFLDVHGMKLGYNQTKPDKHRIVFALVQNAKGDWVPVDEKATYRIAINDYSFRGGEGYDFSAATKKEITPDKIAVALEHYLARHKELTIQPPSRIVAMNDSIAKLVKKGDDYTVVISNAPAAHRATIVSGTGVGIEALKNGIPVPMKNVKELETAKVSADGTATIHIEKAKLGSDVTSLCAIVHPDKLPEPDTASKKTIISYPMPLN